MPEMTAQTALTAAVKRFGIRLYGEGCSSYPPIEGEDYHTWAVGRLIEAMGERMSALMQWSQTSWAVYLKPPRKGYSFVYGTTALGALIAARTAMLEEENRGG